MPDTPTRESLPYGKQIPRRGALVWDLPLRLFHWLLVLAVAGSWLTHKLGTRAFAWHEWCGYTTLVLLFFRFVWGFIGPHHARFRNFVRGPVATWSYARGLLERNAGPSTRTAGHNPLGALMLVVLLAMLSVQGVAGLFANDEILNTGPLYGYVDDDTSDDLSRLHRKLSDALWIAIGVHVAAILLYWLLKGQNLLTPMFTGRKPDVPPRAGEELSAGRLWMAVLVAGVGAALLYAVIATAPEPSMLLF